MKRISEKEWLEDFQEFVKSGSTPVPGEASAAILERVRADLLPSAWLVFTKLLGIHAVVGTLSLAVCDQFGMSPFSTGFSLADYFMEFGASACMSLCGVLFVGLTVAVAGFVLRPEELRVIYRRSALQVFGLGMISLGVFAAFGAEIAFGLGLLWLIGAELGGILISRLFRPRRLGHALA